MLNIEKEWLWHQQTLARIFKNYVLSKKNCTPNFFFDKMPYVNTKLRNTIHNRLFCGTWLYQLCKKNIYSKIISAFWRFLANFAKSGDYTLFFSR